MASFPEFDLNGRNEVRVNGRGLFSTDSAIVCFRTYGGREEFTIASTEPSGAAGGVLGAPQPAIPSTALLEAGQRYAFPYEADGYFIIDVAASYNNYEAGKYMRFDLQPGLISPIKGFVPFTSLITALDFPNGVVNITPAQGPLLASYAIDVVITYSRPDGTTSNVHLYAQAAFDLLQLFPGPGAPFLGASGYPGFSGNVPAVAVSFPSYINYPARIGTRNQDGTAATVIVPYNDAAGQGQEITLKAPPGIGSAQIQSIFHTGALYRGPSGYSGFSQ